MAFLTTKLYRPRVRSNAVVRLRLFRQLEQALQTGSPLILVSAPPGFGKTTLVSAWAAQSGLPLAWVSLDETDNDPVRFWSYLASALMMALPGLESSLAGLPQSSQATDLDFYRQELVNQLAHIDQSFLLVLDDYHLIDHPAIHSGLDQLINHLMPGKHVILLTRADPPLHLPRRRARGEMVEIRAADLRFSGDEAEEFVHNCMQLDLSADDMNALETRTEGWITGLQLAAITLRKIEDRHAFIQAFHGDDRLVTDYLVEEVLLQQPEAHQSFLLQTSVLSRLNARLCNAVTGRSGAEQILEQMENDNLFLIPLDNQREWFRYHSLFARLLQKKLEQSIGQQRILSLLHRASEECIRQGLLVEGIQYLFSAGDDAGAAALISQYAHALFHINELPMLMQWSARLSDSTIHHMPGLCLSFGWAAHATGNPDRSQHFVHLVEADTGWTVEAFLDLPLKEQQALPKNVLAGIIEAVVLQARLDIDRGIDKKSLDRYSRILPLLVQERDSEPYANNAPSALRPVMTIQIGIAYFLLGNPALAAPAFEETVRLSKPLKNHFLVALGLGYLGQIRAEQGQLSKADEIWQEALAYARETGVEKDAFFSIALVGLASLAYERNDLTNASRFLDEGIRLAKTWPAWQGLLPGFTLLSLVRQASGDSTGAANALEELSRFSQSAPQILIPALEAYRALLRIRQDQVGQAAAWLETAKPQNLDQALIQAEGFLKTGKPSLALRMVDQIIRDAEKSALLSIVIRGLALKAVALQSTGRQDLALVAFHHALQVAKNEGYLRTFVDLGGTIEDLLKKGFPPGLEQYGMRLLSAFPRSGDPSVIAAEQANTRLPDPLTARELEILRLIVAGKDNEEIASTLYISIHTVKKRVTHLFAKLEVDNRLQAVEKSRRLGLLP